MAMILLSGLTALSLAAATAAITSLALVGHQQEARLAFEAAEAGIDRALARVAESRSPSVSGDIVWPGAGGPTASFRTETLLAAVPGPDPEGFSLGEAADAFAARHFLIVARGTTGPGAIVQLEQGFYLVVPAP